MEKINKILKGTFGFDSFRGGQENIIKSVVNGQNTMVFMPTGGGKSLTYQIPGLARKGLAIVISPLISLMKDQVDALRELGVSAELINSTIGFAQQQNILNEISKNNESIKFLYIAPERLNSSHFLRVLQNIDISLVAIDEAHCISQWGHDFRPSYMKVRGFVEKLQKKSPPLTPSPSGEGDSFALSLPPEGGKVRLGESQKSFPLMALTATATQKVKTDIIERLGLENYRMFTAGFDRKNIILIVREISKKDEKLEKTFEILAKTPGSGIIYCSSRKAVKEVYDFLVTNGVKAGMYTGAMTADNREQMQNDFMDNSYKVIVATNAFGMGIDKKDIRFVIHYNLPGSIENYYQEVGRAGRDGKNSFGIVLASYQDTKIQEFFIENSNPSKQEIFQVYDYLHDIADDNVILKTYYDIASGSGVNNDMKVGSIIKILEKYGIVKRGVDDMGDSNFRGRGITLTQEKRQHSHIMIDWRLQKKLEDEAYFKLDQIKKMLFYPHCRRRFILEYFGDEDDVKNLAKNCGTCDFCIESKKFDSGEIIDIVPLSVFGIVLDTILEHDDKFGVVTFAGMLTGSQEKKLLLQHLDESDFYGALEDYKKSLVKVVIESLVEQRFLKKSDGTYPLLKITDLGEAVIYKDSLLKEKNRELQQFIHMKYKPKAKKGSSSTAGGKKRKSGNYDETLQLFQQGKSLSEIAELKGVKERTIEGHILKLYENNQLDLAGLMKTVEFQNIKFIKKIITQYFSNGFEFLKDVKAKCSEEGQEVERNEISVCRVMMEKKDI